MNRIFRKIKTLRDLVYRQAEQDRFVREFGDLEKKGHFRVYSPDLFDLKSKIGAYSYVAQGTIVTDCEIGRFTSIGPNCTIGYGQHPVKWPSTSPVFSSAVPIFGSVQADKSYFGPEHARIVIGSDVWIGAHAYIRNGVTVGHGSIIAAGSVVVKDVAPYSIMGGVPAKLIRKRFDEKLVGELLEIKWWDKDIALLKRLQPYFVSEDISSFINAIKKNES